MDLDTIIFVAVVVFFVFGGLLKRLLEAVAKAGEQQAGKTEYVAPPDAVREFLRSLHEAKAEPPQREAARPAAPRAARATSVRRSALRPGEAEQAARRREEPAAAPRRRARRPAPTAPSTPAEELKAAPLSLLALRRIDLKQAIVWAEILGPPVALRGPRRPGSPARH